MTQRCSKCKTTIDQNNRITIASAIGIYGNTGEPLPDNNCPGGGGHTIIDIDHGALRIEPKMDYVGIIFFLGLILTVSTLLSLFNVVLFLAADQTSFNQEMWTYMDWYAIVVVGCGTGWWFTQRIERIGCQPVWRKLADCCCDCFVDEVLRFEFSAMTRYGHFNSESENIIIQYIYLIKAVH
eukprot:96590_1